MILFIVGLIVFLGIHSVSIAAPTWRDAQVARNPGAWKGLYSVVSVIGFVLLVYGYGLARQVTPVVWSPPTYMRHIALLVMLPVFPLLLAAYLPGRIKTAAKHPMLLAVKFWALAHLLANGTLVDMILFGAFLAWAVADRIAIKRRRNPHVIPVAPRGPANDAIVVVGGLVLYVAFVMVIHRWLIGVSPLM
ncbi:MAG: NnrU family protein [Dokdonella sp.]|uniref:NnrU family protein n=1 Tax=Dokdonella sp. TaxID=2291710 RepID=UPI003267A6FE